jgi:hypothetical protein
MLINPRQASSAELLSWIKLTFDRFDDRSSWCISPSHHWMILGLHQHHQLSPEGFNLAA